MSEPVRTCVACRTPRSQSRLVRVVHTNAGGIWVDPGLPAEARRPAGRGAYVCPDEGCIDRACRAGALTKALRYDGPLPERLGEELRRAGRRRSRRAVVNGEVGDGETEGA